MFPGRKGEVTEKVMRAIKENEVYLYRSAVAKPTGKAFSANTSGLSSAAI